MLIILIPYSTEQMRFKSFKMPFETHKSIGKSDVENRINSFNCPLHYSTLLQSPLKWRTLAHSQNAKLFFSFFLKPIRIDPPFFIHFAFDLSVYWIIPSIIFFFFSTDEYFNLNRGSYRDNILFHCNPLKAEKDNVRRNSLESCQNAPTASSWKLSPAKEMDWTNGSSLYAFRNNSTSLYWFFQICHRAIVRMSTRPKFSFI